MSDDIKKRVVNILREMGPEDFGAGDSDQIRDNREHEDISPVGGAGTLTREAARKKLARVMAQMGEMAVDPERDGSFLVTLDIFLNWADAIYRDLPEYKSTEHTLKYILASHGHKG